jgi:hypothetical protein
MNESARGGEQRQASARGLGCDPLDQTMFSPLVSKVNLFHLADFATRSGLFLGERHWECLRLPGLRGVRLGMGKMQPECSDAAPPGADVILRQEPDTDEDEEEDDRKKEGDDEDDTDDGYSE